VVGADFFRSVETIRDRLKANPVPIQIPIGAEDKFIGMIDLVEMKAEIYKDDAGFDIEITDVPDDMKDLAEEYRENLIDEVSNYDDELMMLYLEGEEIPEDMLKKAIRKG